MPSYLPKPRGYLLDRDSNGRYRIYAQIDDVDSPYEDDRPLYAEIDRDHTHRDRTSALMWLYTYLGKQQYAPDADNDILPAIEGE